MEPETKKSSGWIVWVVIAIIIIGAAVWFLSKGLPGTVTPGQNASTTAESAAAQAEVQSLVAAVGKAIILPTDETPTVATVSDPSKLKDQPFFANAKVGDKVLIYANARKAILWDPVAGKILEVSTLTIAPPQNATPAPTATTNTKKTQ